MVTWTKLEDGSWGVKIENSDFHPGEAVGFPFTVTARSGEKKRVVLGEFVKTFMPKGQRGRHTDIYKVAA